MAMLATITGTCVSTAAPITRIATAYHVLIGDFRSKGELHEGHTNRSPNCAGGPTLALKGTFAWHTGHGRKTKARRILCWLTT
jgi:hypothetical protein